jgi:trimeric autotransporter adhesin
MQAMRIGLAILAVGLAGAAGSAVAGDAKVGVAAAVTPDAVGQPQAQASRTLYVGNDVLHMERIATQGRGQVQLLFIDQSSLTVAPNSDVVIDSFVYDPAANTGKMSATISKGLMRYVGGRISKQSDVTFNTPSSVVSVRGGIGFVIVAPDGGTRAVFVYGYHLCVTAGGATECARKPGYEITVAGAGQSPSSPSPVPGEFIADLLQQFEGPPGSKVGSDAPDLNIPDNGTAAGVNGLPPINTGTAMQNGATSGLSTSHFHTPTNVP